MAIGRAGRLIRRLWRVAKRILVLGAIAAVLLVLLFRWVNPPTNYLMLTERLRLGGIAQQWVPIDDMADVLPLSAAAAEDANFCHHAGFDLDGIRSAFEDTHRLRGGSTISQQVAKNVFLWPGRSWLRKGLEAGFTMLIELSWSKRRIIEVYLNVAEFGEGIFGVQAAAQHHFKTDAARVTAQQAARLMTVLPDPRDRSPVSGSRYVARRGLAIQRGAETLRQDGRGACFLG